MKKSILPLVLALLLGASTASAQAIPYFNDNYFVGTTAELLVIRAAFNHLYGDASLANGWAGMPPASWTSPHDEPYADRLAMADPFGLGAVDCMPLANTTATYYWGDVVYFLGQSALVDGVLETIPSEFVPRAEIPAGCEQYIVELSCGGPLGSEGAETLCGEGVPWCCQD